VKVIIAGGSGMIGTHLTESLATDGHEVVVLTRGSGGQLRAGVRTVNWDGETVRAHWLSELSDASGVVNLAGTSIGGGRWTRQRMAEILASRLAATNALVEAIRQTEQSRRPSVLVSASGIDYYGDRGDEDITEESAPGSSFLASVCKHWEAAAEPATALGVRAVRMRTSLVFAREALAFRLLTLPFKLFVGGPLGNGRQWFTWIHIDDIVGLYRLALERSGLSGPINAVAPDVRRQREVAHEIGRILHRPSVLPTPAPFLRLALGRQAELLLDGRHARPTRAEASGYRFKFGRLHDALQEALKGS
jgi:uncharacterized protein (TIGR01777 family)